MEKKCYKIVDGEGRGYNVNVSLEHELRDDDLLAVFDYVFLPLANQFKPDFVLVSAGYDAGKMWLCCSYNNKIMGSDC